ncbi:SYC2L protein, partial [Trogon melanurus]|nr:SYC2L protein [Trogon melanurus]
SDYRKHLFSESDNGNTSTGQSEKSWILESQKRPLTKSVDYTRKKMRVRSKLKVLPVSSASSGGDYQTEKGTSKQRAQKGMLRNKSTSSSKGDNLPTVDLTDDMLSEELEENPLPFSASPRGHSSDKKSAQKSHNASGKLSREEGSFKQEDSDVLSDPIIKKPKFSSLEASHLSSDTSYKPKKLFDSVEKKEDIQTGKEMDDNVDDVFFSKMVNGDSDGSGLIAAFECFTGQLKKSYWSQYKRRKVSALNTLRASEKNLFTLLHQIHEC